jgi:hypothetical protein
MIGLTLVVAVVLLAQQSSAFTHLPNVAKQHLNRNTMRVDSSASEVDAILEQITGKWKLVKWGRGGDAYYGAEIVDKKFYAKTEKIMVSTAGGIGLELVEAVDMGDRIGGLVLVGGVREGSNADKSGLFQIGDVLMNVQTPETPIAKPNLEGLNYDLTLDTLGGVAASAEGGPVAITVQRLAMRKEIKTVIVGPNGEEVVSFDVLAGFGSNLRTALQVNNLKMYDDRTSRFDSPFQTGNCGGEGTCGTCVIAVLEGNDLISTKATVEEKALRIQAAPPNYRWACRLRIGDDPSKGGTLKIKLRPQTSLWDWKAQNQK